MKAARLVLIFAAAAATMGAWRPYDSAVDLVADAAVAAPAFPSGVYCPVVLYPDFTDLDVEACARLSWDDAHKRHYRTPADVTWAFDRDWPVAQPTLDGFGARSTWLDVAEAPRGLVVAQGGGVGEGAEAEGDYSVVVARFNASGFAVLPTPDAATLEALADAHSVTTAALDTDDDDDRIRLVDGASTDVRALVGDAAVAWLEKRRAESGDFRQPRLGDADADAVGPAYYVRIDALREDLPLETALQTALFEIETAVGDSARDSE